MLEHSDVQAIPIHSGKILAGELAVTAIELSRQPDVPPNRMTQIIHGKCSITGKHRPAPGPRFKTSPQFWLNLQTAYDLRAASQEAGLTAL